MKTQLQQTKDQIAAALASVNGRRRVRTLSASDVTQAIREALRDVYGYVHAGTVANKYNYPAESCTVFAVRRPDGGVRVAVGSSNAKKGSSPRPGYMAAYVPQVTDRPVDRAKMAAWANMDLETADYSTADAHGDGLIFDVPARVCRVMIREADRAAQALKQLSAGVIPAITVTLADSLASGNCRHESHRVVAEYFGGRTEAPAAELIRVITSRAPHLLPYARRAVAHAVRGGR